MTGKAGAQGDRANSYVQEILHEEVAGRSGAVGAPRPKRDPSVPLFVVALLLFVGTTAWNVATLNPDGPVFTAQEEESSARFRMYVVAQQLEDYRRENGALPPDLATIGEADAGIGYSRNEARYVLTSHQGTRTITYRSGDSMIDLMLASGAGTP